MHTFVLAIQMVVLNTRVNAGARPLAIVSSLLYCVLFRNSRLQGDASLQMLFAVVAPRGRSRRGVGLAITATAASQFPCRCASVSRTEHRQS